MMFLNQNVFSDQLYIDTEILPMELSFQRVKGDGSKNIYIFCDVDCPHCARAEKNLKELDNITINTFVLPVPSYHPDAPRKTDAIWCSEDKAKSWQEWFDNGVLPEDAENCKSPWKDVESYAHKNNITLPAIIFEDGSTYHAEDFIKVISNAKTFKTFIDFSSK